MHRFIWDTCYCNIWMKSLHNFERNFDLTTSLLYRMEIWSKLEVEFPSFLILIEKFNNTWWLAILSINTFDRRVKLFSQYQNLPMPNQEHPIHTPTVTLIGLSSVLETVTFKIDLYRMSNWIHLHKVQISYLPQSHC